MKVQNKINFENYDMVRKIMGVKSHYCSNDFNKHEVKVTMFKKMLAKPQLNKYLSKSSSNISLQSVKSRKSSRSASPS